MNITGRTTEETIESMVVCPVCGSELVCPVGQRQVGTDSWELMLRCPECFAGRVARAGTALVSALGREYCRTCGEIERQLRELERRHMEEECGRFIAALEQDLIQPMDF
jgi:translation initiation factor 2 beta subunit (eIF-2beta)/eIF-5